MTDQSNTPAVTVPATLGAFDSKSPEYSILSAACDGFRITTLSPVSIAAQIVQAATEAESKGAQGIAARLSALPVAVAGHGKVSLAELSTANPDALGVLPGAAGFVLSLVNVRGIEVKTAEGAEKRNGVIGLALYPAHPVESFQTTDEGRAFLTTILDKEQGLNAFRKLRFTPGESTEEDFDAGAKAMPITAEDFLPSRTTASEGFDLFNDIYPLLARKMSSDPTSAPIIAALPTKRADVLAAIRSASLARTLYPALEERDIFAKLGRVLFNTAESLRAKEESDGKAWGYNNASVLRWIDERESLDLLPKVKADVDTDAIANAFAVFGV